MLDHKMIRMTNESSQEKNLISTLFPKAIQSFLKEETHGPNHQSLTPKVDLEQHEFGEHWILFLVLCSLNIF